MSAIRKIGETGAPDGEPRRVERQKIGRYRLVFQLAAGGMATVYLARADGPEGFDKLVALKRIHPHLAQDRAYVDMFLDEARIASRITHANVCSVFDFGEAEGEYYIAMEYLVGESLSRVVRHLAKERSKATSKPYPSFCARLISDACEGLHAAHELKDARGEPLHVVHRDISPQNLFVSYDGVMRVVDFGIASARDKLYQTSTGEVKGKFAYMAPEQLRDGSRVDRRTDVWALGVVLWEMLTMRRLFRKKSQPETMYAVLEGNIPAPSEVRNGVPPELDAIVLKALSRDLDERYPTARAMGRALVEFVARSGEPIGLADVSEWMAELFPGGEARTRQIMDIARLPSEVVPSLDRQSVEMEIDKEGSFSSIRTAAGQNPPSRRKLLLRLSAAGGLMIAALSGAAFGIWGLGEEPPPEAAVAAVEAPVEPTAETEPTPAPEPIEEPDVQEPDVQEPDVQAPDVEAPPPEAAVEEAPEPPAPRRRGTRARSRATPAEAPATPAPDPEPARAAAAQTGTVSVIVSGGWANVYDAGGTFLGATPLRVELPAGRQRLQLRPFGQPPPAYVTVDVPAGGRARVRHTIESE